MFRAEIIATGDELLSGETVDTNSSYIDRELESHGWSVAKHHIVPDDLDRIVEALTLAVTQSQLVITTGGLGPTQDDLTFEALAKAMNVPLELHEPTLEHIRQIFARFGRTMSENNRRQAVLPQGAEILENRLGTAPGVLVQLDGCPVFSLPGVPREMKALLKHQVLPRTPRGETVARSTIQVAGLGESALETTLGETINRHPEVRFGFRAKIYENDVKLVANGRLAESVVESAQRDVLSTLGARVVSTSGEGLEAVTIEALSQKQQTVAVAESCTGGMACSVLVDVPGASSVVRGGIVAYANEVKQEVLGVSAKTLQAHGAVSEEIALEMAQHVRDRMSTTWGISTTGIAGPGGGSPEKPVGTVWIGLAGPDGQKRAWLLNLQGRSREVIRLATTKAIIDKLRLTVLGLSPDKDA